MLLLLFKGEGHSRKLSISYLPLSEVIIYPFPLTEVSASQVLATLMKFVKKERLWRPPF